MAKYSWGDVQTIRVSSMKQQLREMPLRYAAIPIVATYSVAQQIGKEALPVVKVGDRVEEGMLLAKSTAMMSANIHTAVPGTVKKIESRITVNGRRTTMIDIATGGKFKVQASRELREYAHWGKQEILAELSAKGVVGMGGATFPTHVKWAVQEELETLIINAVECEPYAAGDYRLLVERSADIAKGVAIAIKLTGAKRICLALEKSAKAAIPAVYEELNKLGLTVDVLQLSDSYPQGAEKLLVYYATGVRLEVGELPSKAGCAISNVATLLASYEALALNKPVTERAVTISGAGIVQPANLLVRLGTPIGFLIEECGGLVNDKVKVIAGGPMMGFSVIDLETPLTKGMGAILGLMPKEVKESRPTACIGCTACKSACPLSLAPKEMYHSLKAGRLDMAEGFGLKECFECGACSFVCPARLELSHTFAHSKKDLVKHQNMVKKE